ncbi:SapC family protein [Altererythrobacter arenosus]|uniref:SapC family protein n=1 Tax=Altererythrobacter arenosus TaxID=3032592 RepID=A0ABY8FX45_9SPHN|nr:SapC family protein [Altererythrobacter sp. CAU 1644]WFL78558.1 SapC family protein [Altererythrobacter sp. CAU 1644]
MTDHRILNSEEHRELRVLTDSSAELGDAVMGCLTVPLEFRRVQSCFPIVFRRDPETDAFSAMALFGFTNGENLFLVDGKWDARYKPLAQSIQPFLVGRSRDDDAAGQVHVDMEHPRISQSGEGMRVFDEDGQATPYLEEIAAQLGMLHEGYQSSAGFFEAMKRYDLLEPFSVEVPLADGSKHSLVGFHTIHEERLAALSGDELAVLQQGGHLLPIYMALASIDNFAELVARKNRQVMSG